MEHFFGLLVFQNNGPMEQQAELFYIPEIVFTAGYLVYVVKDSGHFFCDKTHHIAFTFIYFE